MPHRSALIVALLLTACGGGASRGAPGQEPKPEVEARALYTTPLSGQTISVLPLTMVLVSDSLRQEDLLSSRERTLPWVDSVLGQTLENRASEVKWVLPPALRRIAKRAPGIAPDPDRMGQAIMRAPKLEILPDPLRAYARDMVALAGGRMVLIPSIVTFDQPQPGTVRARLAMVLADVRTAKVIWRTLAPGTGSTPGTALEAALRTVLPVEME